VDKVMFCISKTLGAPAGSLLTGPAEAMARGRLYRKRLGGGMRQAGVLAAAALIALDETPKCLPGLLPSRRAQGDAQPGGRDLRSQRC